jgi:hypothetical protein
MTRTELARYWNDQIALWFQDQPLSPSLERWRHAYLGDLQEWAFPEPYIGNLLGSPRIVLLANNPGIAHEELQSAASFVFDERQAGSGRRIMDAGATPRSPLLRGRRSRRARFRGVTRRSSSRWRARGRFRYPSGLR